MSLQDAKKASTLLEDIQNARDLSINHTTPPSQRHNLNSTQSYSPTERASATPDRRSGIISEDLEFNLPRVPTLFQIAVEGVIDNFEESPDISRLPNRAKIAVLDGLPVDLSLPIALNHIFAQGYWVRRLKAEWPQAVYDKKDKTSPRREWCQRTLSRTLELWNPEVMDNDDLMELLTLCAPFTQKLKLETLPGHPDMAVILGTLEKVSDLNLVFGVGQVGLDFSWDLVGMRQADASSIGTALKASTALTRVSLQRSLIDDKLMRPLAAGVSECNQLKFLDLSHNKLGNFSVKALAACLAKPTCQIEELLLDDNHVKSEGGTYLAKGVAKCNSLQKLSLRLNNIGDEGAAALLDSVAKSSSLVNLNISANSITFGGICKINEVALVNKTLVHLDLACNNGIGIQASQVLMEAATSWSSLKTMVLRLSGLGHEFESRINTVLLRRPSEA